MKLSIITIVKDDFEGLSNTIRSVEQYACQDGIEHVIWVSSASKNIALFKTVRSSPARSVHIKDDEGIWDAMNQAMRYANGSYLLFLNARDEFKTQLDLNAIESGCLLPVEYVDWFGILRRVHCKHQLRHGIPYCHQGIIFPNRNLKYDIHYKFCADYLFVLEHFPSWPPPMLEGGLVHYDNTGVSSKNRLKADLWAVKCVYHRFSSLTASYVLLRTLAKAASRVVLSPFRGLIQRIWAT